MVCPGARSSGAHAGRRSFCRVIGTTEGVIGTTEGVIGTTEGVIGTTEGVIGTTEGVIGTTEGVIGTTEVVRFHVLDFPTLARKRRSLGVEQRRTRGPTRNFVPTEILRPAMQSAGSQDDI